MATKSSFFGNLTSNFPNLFGSKKIGGTPTTPSTTSQLGPTFGGPSPISSFFQPPQAFGKPAVPQVKAPFATSPSPLFNFGQQGVSPSGPKAPIPSPGASVAQPTQTPAIPSLGQIPAASASAAAPQAAQEQDLPSLAASASPEALKALEIANKAFEQASKISAGELSTEEDLEKLIESTQTAFKNIEGQAIPLSFITGQLGKVASDAESLAQPLQFKLANLQAKRQAAIESSKFALERAEDTVDDEREEDRLRIERDEDRRRFELEQEAFARQEEREEREFEENVRQFGLQQALESRKIALQEKAAAGSPQGEDFLTGLGRRGLDVATNAVESNISAGSIGPNAVATAFLPGTEAFNMRVNLDALKSQIGFGTLQQMRAASKTGGALGQVSNIELGLLQANLGSLNQFQSEASFRKNLTRVVDSLQKWQTALEENPDEASGIGSGEAGGANDFGFSGQTSSGNSFTVSQVQ